MYPGTWAEATPDKDAIVMGGGERVTYRELNDRSMQLAQLLHARGLRPGDHIAIFAENHPRYYEVYWAAMRSGLYLTAVNRHLKADEAAYLVNDSGFDRPHHDGRDGRRSPTEMLEHIGDCPIRLMMDGAAPRFRELRGRDRGAAGAAARRAAQGRGDALLVRHDRAAEGHQAADVGPGDRRPESSPASPRSSAS